jgi:hypothetical protein
VHLEINKAKLTVAALLSKSLTKFDFAYVADDLPEIDLELGLAAFLSK